LRELLGRLEQKQRELTEQRNELLAWFRRRQADLAQKASELSQRNQRLIAERQQLRDQQLEQQTHQFQTLQLRQKVAQIQVNNQAEPQAAVTSRSV
jgi:hypothetical protein